MAEFTPTAVIGIGESGARMVSQIDETMREEGIGDSLLPIVVDTKSDEMENYASAVGERNQHVLRHPVDDLSERLPERAYLDSDERIPGEGGAQKSRSLGRFYLDSEENFDRTYYFFEDRFDELISRQRDGIQNFDVWIVNAYGGGTGSGVFPLLSAIVHEVCDDEVDPAARIRGIGTLPKLVADEVDVTTPEQAQSVFVGDEELTLEGRPEGDNRHRLNTYGALRDLRMLLDDTNDGPVKFDLSANSDVFKYGELRLNGSPFDDYFLLAFDEEKNGRETYQREINTIVARLVYYIATVESAEDYPEGVALSKLTDLCTIDAAMLQFPTATAAEYLSAHQRQGQIGTLLTYIERQQEQFADDLDYLNSVLALPQGRIPDEASSVEQSTVRLTREESQVGVDDFPMEYFDEDTVRDAATDTAKAIVNERKTSLQTRFSLAHLEIDADGLSTFDDISGGHDLVTQPRQDFRGAKQRFADEDDDDADDTPERWDDLRSLDVETVVEYLYYDQFATRVREDLRQAEFDLDQTVSELWGEYADEFREQFPQEYETYQGAESEKQAEGLRQFLTEQVTGQNTDDGGILDFNLSLGGSDADDFREDKKRLKQKQQALTTARKRQRVIEEIRSDVSEELKRRRNQIEDADDALEEWADRLESRKEQAENRATGKRQRLESWYAERFADMEVANVDGLEPSVLRALRSNEKTVDDLITDGILSESRVTDNISSLIGNLDEPLEDLDVVDSDPTSILSLLYSDENSQGVWFEEFSRIAKDRNIDQASEKRVHIRNSAAFFFLAVYTNIDVRNMSEYSLLHEAAADDVVSELLVGDHRDALENHLQRSIAYPELLDRESEVSAN
jgi:hypothetical protein